QSEGKTLSSIFLCSILASSNSRITLSDENVSAQAGLCVVLACSFTTEDKDVENITWYKHDGNVTKTIFGSPEKCSVLIHDLKITDSGNYSFRFVGEGTYKWVTKPFTSLTVADNPCLLTFEEPKTVTENDNVTLTCHTLTSCTSDPEIKALGPLSPSLIQSKKSPNTATLSFKVTWEDDGRMFSCQTENNTDPCLIRNISLTVGYPPDVDIVISPEPERMTKTIIQGDKVTFTCSVKRSNPSPDSFTWLKDTKDKTHIDSKQITVKNIQPEDSGKYTCSARNTVGSRSKTLQLTVQCKFYTSGSWVLLLTLSSKHPFNIIQL
uniref:B-cell receptor CD22 n=1 Tax=Neolamprologus brichardi TaxID=32507 RepID=A0A3Q4MMY7_NEOBR